MSSDSVRPEISKDLYNKVMIASGVKVSSGLETALESILRKLKTNSKKERQN